MKRIVFLPGAALLILAHAVRGEPLALHPANPHYFLYAQKPAILITSGEHYGAVLNRDFDFRKYIDTLAADGLNLTRTFSGAYVEPEGAFKIAENTLAPRQGRFLCPWARSDQTGYANGGNKFDLTKWDDDYFARLKEFVRYAKEHGVIVEMNLFCPMYEEMQWKISPMNAANNINGFGKVGKHDVYDLTKNRDLQPLQEALARKIVGELRDADNVYYEICNEPYFGGVTLEWQHRIADVIVEAEKEFPNSHLLSQNVANGAKKITSPHPAISIFNFHYAHPPDAVAQNYALEKVIGDNETGFKGTADDHYRMEAWAFILAGGGLYNNLDYSFTVGHEDGTFQYPATQPGAGSVAFRKQMAVLARFIKQFDFVKMKPAREIIIGTLPKGARAQLLAEPGRQFAAYFKGAPRSRFTLDLPAGKYATQWTDVITGKAEAPLTRAHSGGPAEFEIPSELNEVALRIVRAD